MQFNYGNVHFFEFYHRYSNDFPGFTRSALHITIISLFLLLSFSLLLMHQVPPNNSALTSLQLRHKDISRSPAGHLLNSSAYVSLIRVCKSIATGGGQGRVRESEQGWRIACGQVVGVRASPWAVDCTV